MKTKDEVLQNFKSFKLSVENQSEKRIKTLRSEVVSTHHMSFKPSVQLMALSMKSQLHTHLNIMEWLKGGIEQ
jgi:hypothetical protein